MSQKVMCDINMFRGWEGGGLKCHRFPRSHGRARVCVCVCARARPSVCHDSTPHSNLSLFSSNSVTSHFHAYIREPFLFINMKIGPRTGSFHSSNPASRSQSFFKTGTLIKLSLFLYNACLTPYSCTSLQDTSVFVCVLFTCPGIL